MRDYKGIAGVLIIFLIGGIVGAIITQYVCSIKMEHMHPGGTMGGPGHMTDMIVKHITKDLGLDNEQKEKLRVIMDKMDKKMAIIHKQVFPQIKLIIEEADNSTMSILRADQKEVFKTFIERRNAFGPFN
ncbi:hypothetical protein [Candidatus Magnetominusculus dajiuhuensis]|uniref:hypothetical protein n=1 Tax=Candidatus Magnetominusculus dajiuhuensis TaxID=3137712 RepID=UPI003B42A1AE